MSAAAKLTPAGSSAEARATKLDRLKYLQEWSYENPLATIEAAREAVRAKFGISLGTKIIADTLRHAKLGWDAERRAQHQAQAVPPKLEVVPQQPPAASGNIGQVLAGVAREMQASGIRLIEVLPDGNVRVELGITPSPHPS